MRKQRPTVQSNNLPALSDNQLKWILGEPGSLENYKCSMELRFHPATTQLSKVQQVQ
jgi:hypothetical protein